MSTRRKLGLLALPWLLGAAGVIVFEIDRIDLPETIGKPRRERRIHFLQKAMPSVPGHVFTRLIEQNPRLAAGERYALIYPEDLPVQTIDTIRAFAKYCLYPGMQSGRPGEANIMIDLRPEANPAPRPNAQGKRMRRNPSVPGAAPERNVQ